MTHGQFLSGVQLILTLSFHSSKLVAYQGKRTQSAQLFTHNCRGKERVLYFFQRHKCELKHKQPYPGTELGLPIPFPTMITIMLTVPPSFKI